MNLLPKDVYVDEKLPYLRPFLCQGEFNQADVLLAGINPATPIGPSDKSVDEYLELLKNYDRFKDCYKKLRTERGKSGISPTRRGIESFVKWIALELNKGVIETNLHTYPAKAAKELKAVPSALLKRSQELFWSVFEQSRATFLILHIPDINQELYHEQFKNYSRRKKLLIPGNLVI